MEGMRRCSWLLLLWVLSSTGLFADAPAFDLAGPKVDVHVKRGEVTLPIGEVPNLLPGDRLWVHPDLPESQSAHYVLVVAFLRGSTNPPPADWFTRIETWNKQVRSEGVFVTVPAEAQQALLFLAPETGGDFSTLRAAVRGRPGAFVRATQDLQAASFDRMRLDNYLASVKDTTQMDPKLLKDRTELAARSLGIKIDKECFDKPTDQQAPCLTDHTDGLVLDDSNAQSMVVQLANGATGDLMNQLSYSTLAGAGTFSPYVGAIVDTARILSSLHTAHFQYIPALALPTKDTLNLRLNVPPSFRDPKSVVVVALPSIGPSKPPMIRAVNPDQKYCAQKPRLVLAVEGAPALYSTQLGYGLQLRVETQANGKTTTTDLPVSADAPEGGLVLTDHLPEFEQGEATAYVHGKWGFDDWTGPHFHLQIAQAGKWAVSSAEQSALVVGREDTVHLEDDSTACVDKVEGQLAAGGKAMKLDWKSSKPSSLEVAVPMKDAEPGPVTIEVYQFGLAKPDKVALTAYAEAASLDGLTLSVGEKVAQLHGTRLDEVAKAELDGVTLKPGKLSRVKDLDQLSMNVDGATTSLEAGKSYTATVQLQDGRQLKTPVTVAQPRPRVALLNKGQQDKALQDGAPASASPVHLGSSDDLPVDGRLVFFIKSEVPPTFARDEKVEVAAVDGSFSTTLSLADATLMLEDAKTAMGNVEPLARFGASAFGPVQLRVVSADGVTGDWLPLGTLVRMPAFKELHCPRAASKPCMLTGSNLFLATAFASTGDMNNATEVPPDFTGIQMAVPHPVNGTLYLKLRDDPATTQTLAMPVVTNREPAAPAAAAPVEPVAPTTPTDKADPKVLTGPDAPPKR